jgi:beta-glucuronidase
MRHQGARDQATCVTAGRQGSDPPQARDRASAGDFSGARINRGDLQPTTRHAITGGRHLPAGDAHAAARPPISAARRIIAGIVMLSLVLTVAGATLARAQAPLYAAQPPTKGALYSDGQDGRYLLGGTWLYRPDISDSGLAQGFWRDTASTAGWTPVTVPNAYNAGDFSAASMNGYVGWYRRDFTLPAGAFAKYVPRSARHWIIRFESVNYSATVWLNGHLVGSHTGAYLPFEFDLQKPRAGVNRLIVRVDNRRSPTSFPPGPGGQWWNYGGILREVYLRSVQAADIEQAVIRPVLPCPSCKATIDVQAVIRNVTASPLTVQLRGTYANARLRFGATTIAPHTSWTAAAAAIIAHPHLWSPGDPFLYRARLTLTDADGRRLAGYTDYSGIRSIKVVDGRLELNGRLLNLRGVDLHEQTIATGAAMSPAQIGQLVAWVQALGATVIRAHYPVGPELEELADRDGILIWSEVPVYQLTTQALAQPGEIAQADAILQQNILDNENHPSVLLWSIGNELPTPVSGPEASYIAGAAALARKLDPTRPVAMAVSDWPGVACQSAYAPVDVIGFNDYFGWFDAGGGATDDRDALSPFLDSFRACYPTKALFVSEFGFDANRSGPIEERGTYQFQSDSVAFHLGVFATKPWLSGAIYFALQDYVAYPGYAGGDPWPYSPINQKGLVDLYGNFKPAFAVVQAIYKQTVQIAPAPGGS